MEAPSFLVSSPVSGVPTARLTAYFRAGSVSGEYVILCAQTLQFLSDHKTALSEMRRVLKLGGRVAISIWCEIEKNPYFHALIDSTTAQIGPHTAIGLKSIFGLSNADEICALVAAAGFKKISMNVKQLNLELPKLEEFIPRHVSATPMAAGFNYRATKCCPTSI